MYLIKTEEDIPLDIVDENLIEEVSPENIISKSDLNESIQPDKVKVVKIDDQKLLEYVNIANQSLAKLGRLVNVYHDFLEKAKNYVNEKK